MFNAQHNTAAGAWANLDQKRGGLMRRCEKYAALTIPKICLPASWDENVGEMLHDNQSVGAQSTNHLANKLMMALFSPGSPFFRLDPSLKLRQEMAAVQGDQTKVSAQLSLAETEAIRLMDRLAIRPKLYDAVKHLIVVGNVLIELEDETIRVIGLRNYVVRRSKSGLVLEMIIRDKMQFSELNDDTRAACAAQGLVRKADDEVSRYRWIKRDDNGDYRMTVHVENIELPKKFQGKWPADRLPFRAMTWDLADGFNYGTGLVEDYAGDFAGLSMLSKSQIEGAILSSQFRWLCNPGGMTQPEDVMMSENGAVLPGMEGDLALIQSGKSQDLAVTMQMAAEYIQRIGRAFLLGSAVTRDAERVTAVEMRMQANELETSLGGVYSRMAVDTQIPIAHWLLGILDMDIIGTDIQASIVTGLAALSRGSELENLQMLISDIAALGNLQPAVLRVLKLHNIFNEMASARRIDASKFILSEQELAQLVQQEQQRLQQQQATEAGIQAGADIATASATEG